MQPSSIASSTASLRSLSTIWLSPAISSTAGIRRCSNAPSTRWRHAPSSTRARVTIIHGNHDLASSGGHPREQRDLLAARAAVLGTLPRCSGWRRKRFYRLLSARNAHLGIMPPFRKDLGGGVTLAAVDSVPFPWVPLTFNAGGITLQHARGAIAPRQLAWLAAQKSERPRPADAPLPARRGRLQLALRPLAQKRIVTLAVASRASERHGADGCEGKEPERLWAAIEQSQVFAVFCGHLHRARLDHRGAVAVALNGQSGAEWLGRTIAFYRIEGRSVAAEQRQMPRDVVGA